MIKKERISERMDYILEVYPIHPTIRHELEKNKDVKLINYGKDDFDPKDITAIYTHYSMVTALEMYANCKYIICPCTSIQQLGITLSFKGEIIYLDNKEYLYEHVKSTAEHTMYLMLSLCRILHKDLSKKRIGLIGYGRVAKQVAEMLVGFECDIYFYDPFIQGQRFNYLGTHIRQVHDVNEIFASSDIVSLHITDNVENINFIKYEHFLQVKKPITFINTSRAYLVDPEGLLNAWYDCMVEAIGIDEIETYDYRPKQAFKKLAKNRDAVIITDHTAGQSQESREATDKYVFDKYLNRGFNPIMEGKTNE